MSAWSSGGWLDSVSWVRASFRHITRATMPEITRSAVTLSAVDRAAAAKRMLPSRSTWKRRPWKS